MERTPNEQARLRDYERRWREVRDALNQQSIPSPESSERDWLAFLAQMKEILGNTSNAMTVVATMMAKDYLSQKLPMRPFDAAARPPGARGPDIDERTVDGRRVIGEIKTTNPYAAKDLGAKQKETFLSDFAKLNGAVADYKFFFVTDRSTFEVVKAKYAAQIPGVTVVLLTTGDEFTAT